MIKKIIKYIFIIITILSIANVVYAARTDTSSGSGSGSGTVGEGSTGQLPYYNASGDTLSPTSSIFIDTSSGYVGIGSTTPASNLGVTGRIYSDSITAGATTSTSYVTGKLQVGTSSVPGYAVGVGGSGIFTQNLINTRTSYNVPPTTATRNNFTGSMGYGFTVDQPTLVTELGRLYVAGNTQNHVAYLWNASTTANPLASSTIYASYTSDSDNFKWATITPQRLEPGYNYIVAIDETSGGDAWKDSWAQTIAWQPNFNYNYQAYYTGNGGYPNNQLNTGLGYNTVAMKHKVISTLDVDTTGVNRDGLVLETPYDGYTGGLDYYSMIIKGQNRSSGDGTRYMMTFNKNGNAGMATNGYITIDGSQSEYPINAPIAGENAFMLGVKSDVSPNPAMVMYDITGVATTPLIKMYGGTPAVNVATIFADGGAYFASKMGIGTTSPYSMLSVAGQAVFQNVVATSTVATSTISLLAVGTTTPTNNALFSVGTSTPLIVVDKVTSNVGIGTNAPGQKLSVTGSIGASGNLLCLTSDACDIGTSASTNRFANIFVSTGVSSGSSGNGLTLAAGGANSVKFTTNASQRAVILSTGELGIATTTPWKTLSVVGTMAINGLTAAGSTADAICLNNTTKEVLVNTGLPTCTVSSERAKTNIESLGEAMSTINSLRPVSFELKEDGAKHIGFIAEEVKKVDDRFVFSLADGTSRGVRYEDMVALLAKGMQEQDKKITDLIEKNKELSSRIEVLEKLIKDN